MTPPLCIDLFCGLGGWTEGFLAEGYHVVGFDIEQHVYGEHRYPAQLVLQDVRTIHGAQFKDAAVIVASPPCQEFSYMAMPWTRAKQIAAALRGQGEFPAGYTGSRTVADLRALFDACFRIQREASEAAGHHIPLVVENVRGAQPWVGRSAWNFGSYHLYGDVPAIMPFTFKAEKNGGQNLDGRKTCGLVKSRNGHNHTRHLTNQSEHDNARSVSANQSPACDGVKQAGDWFADGRAGKGMSALSGKSTTRKAASARIAKIPFPLAVHIARVYRP